MNGTAFTVTETSGRIWRKGTGGRGRALHCEAEGSDGADLEEMLRHAEPETVLELMRLKARNGWSDSSFNDLLVLLKKLFPQLNSLPTSTYEVKKLICPLSLGVRKIHACVNHCILFRKEYEDLDRCPTCKSSRYKTSRIQSEGQDVALDDVEEFDPCKDSNKKKIPQLVMWYLPVKDRLKRLFSNSRDAELMRWHHEKRKKDGMIRHPTNARQWKEFDRKYHKFVEDPRNIRSRGRRVALFVWMEPCTGHFDGTVEEGDALEPWEGDKVFRMTKNLKVVFGKVKKKETNKRMRNNAEVPARPSVPFKKHSIFFKFLPYWKDLHIRHSIDVMHLEKNVFDSTIRTILDIPTKTKDGLKSRKDLMDMQIRKELHPVDEGSFERWRDERRGANAGEGAASSGVSRRPRQGARLPTFSLEKASGQVFVASLRNVRWPPKFRPSLTERYHSSVNPSESLQVHTTIIEAAWGDDQVKANFFPMALQGQARGSLMNLPPASVYSWEGSCS
uniref:Transposase family tnp2, putative n=2 Tax=Oryza sativa subsp. japonica TaxID=39947 RepID=Q53JC8_ORYSJ|nr:Transposase family tnp2, putative [Oryza sativa Japonica Group]AAX96710.1 transposon protein, putative, CACTA, En/Spm sub-class [Oryza sativa Japonica Group]ABA93033.1 transposon protein, putative, CACTA, En/Spm sub-class [Oryza sativa Japonica Group]